MPGAIGPTPKFQHSEKSPTSHAGQTGVTPRGPHDSHGFSTTAVADLVPLGLGPERHDVGDDLVAEHLGEREERLHRVVG